MRARQLRRVLASAQPAAAPEERRAGGDDRRRLVRRRGPVRRAGDLPGSVEKQSPGATNVLVMGPWLHGGWDAARRRRRARHRHVRRQDRGVLPREDRAAVLRAPPQGQRRRQASRGVGLRDRHQPSGGSTTPGRRRRARPRRSTFVGRRPAQLPAASGQRRQAFDEYVSDPAKPVPFIDQIGIGMLPEYMVDDQRFAARRPDVLVYQTAPLEQDLTLAGPHRGGSARLHHRHRRRLDRQADRRLSGRLPRPATRTRPACAWAAISSWCAAK